MRNPGGFSKRDETRLIGTEGGFVRLKNDNRVRETST